MGCHTVILDAVLLEGPLKYRIVQNSPCTCKNTYISYCELMVTTQHNWLKEGSDQGLTVT
jgi:hypothetical protein